MTIRKRRKKPGFAAKLAEARKLRYAGIENMAAESMRAVQLRARTYLAEQGAGDTGQLTAWQFHTMRMRASELLTNISFRSRAMARDDQLAELQGEEEQLREDRRCCRSCCGR